jgi:predicted glycosyl hydrolase (DUF1957 family)
MFVSCLQNRFKVLVCRNIQTLRTQNTAIRPGGWLLRKRFALWIEKVNAVIMEAIMKSIDINKQII